MVTAGVVALAAVAGTVILATGGSGGPATGSAAPVSADSVGIFSSDTGRLTGQIPVGASPTAITACDNSIWAASGDAHSVSRIDPVKQVAIASITVGNGPDGIACGDGFVWVTNGLDGTVTKIDPQLDQPVDTIGVGTGPPAWRSAWASSGSRTRTTAA